MKSLAQLRGWIGESVSRRLAIPGLVLILLLLVQAALSTGSAALLVGRLEDSSDNSSASMKLTERLLSAAQELSDHAIRAAADAAAAEAEPLSDLMGSADYRREMIRVWVRRLLTALREGRPIA